MRITIGFNLSQMPSQLAQELCVALDGALKRGDVQAVRWERSSSSWIRTAVVTFRENQIGELKIEDIKGVDHDKKREALREIERTMPKHDSNKEQYERDADELAKLVSKRIGASGSKIVCSHEQSVMTPCVARDGGLAACKSSVSGTGICVGCSVPIETMLAEEKEKHERPDAKQ